MAVVILDSDQIPHGISRKFVKFPGEALDHYYNRVTHLHHQGTVNKIHSKLRFQIYRQKICQIGDLSVVKHLTVLYLYDNKIEKIEHLDAIPHLEMLYLQRNKISTIENIGHLKKLKKLYLSNNRISVVENLQNLINLQELHVDHQDLAPHQNVVFDPRSCSKLKKLRVLNTSKNQMVDLKPLDMIPHLTHLDISGNLLKDLHRIIEILARIPSLQVLDLRGNPLTAVLRYRENVIGSCGYLTTIDGKTVEAQSRLLMTNMRKMRLKKDSSSSSGSSGTLSSAGNSQSSNIVTSTSHILPNNCNDVVSTTEEPVSPTKSDHPTFNISCDEDEDAIGSTTDSDSSSTGTSSAVPDENIQENNNQFSATKNIKEER